jgi:1,4-dihydroxy-2-naphthoyl-CoA hydrolase
MTADPQALVEAMPFAHGCGIRIVDAAPREVRAAMAWAPERCTAGQVMHGGALMTLADSAGAVCAYLNLPSGASTATVDSSTTFLSAMRRGEVHAVSRPLRVGSTVIVVRTELHDDEGCLVAHVVQAQMVRT